MSHDSNTPARNLPREWALLYAGLGLIPVAIRPGLKEPSGGRTWNTAASRDPKVIAKTFRPNNNVGLLMGGLDDRGRQLFALDFDPRHGGDRRAFLAGREFPPTPTDQTPSGGSHHLLLGPPGMTIRSGQNVLGPGIDLIGVGGQVVVEPSRRPDGLYLWTWLPTFVPVSEAPPWLAEAIRAARPSRGRQPRTAPKTPRTGPVGADVVPNGARPQASPDRDALLVHAIGGFPVGGEGQRNGNFYRVVAFLIGQGLPDPEVRDLSLAWWSHWHDLGRCSPPNLAVIDSQIRSGRRAEEEGRLVAGGPSCHRLSLSRIAVSAAQEAALRSSINRGPKDGPAPAPGRLAGGANERALVRALLVHFAHKRAEAPAGAGGPYKATNGQLRELMSSRWGVEVSDGSFWLLLRRYMTTEKHPARKVELIRRVFEGGREKGERVGRPSEYELSPRFVELLDLGVPDGALPAPIPAPVGPDPAEESTRPGDGTEGRDDPTTEEAPTMPDNTREPRTIRLAAPDVLKLPPSKGLVDVLEALRSSDKFSPRDWEEARRWLADLRPQAGRCE